MASRLQDRGACFRPCLRLSWRSPLLGHELRLCRLVCQRVVRSPVRSAGRGRPPRGGGGAGGAALNETETAKVRGTWTDPALGRVLFRDWLGEWWATTTNLRPKTRDRDELLLRRLALPPFGGVPLAAISQRDVRAWVADLSGRGLAPATVQKTYQLLGKVMGAAVDPRLVMEAPGPAGAP